MNLALKIYVDRQGISHSSYMKTLCIEQKYQLPINLTLTTSLDLIYSHQSDNYERLPLNLSSCPGYNCLWLGVFSDDDNEKNDNNILGPNGKLVFKSEKNSIDIPVLDPYSECLIPIYDNIYLPGNKPIFQTIMDIGKNYVNDYILQPSYGNGIYLELHDTPHVHIPMDHSSSGHIIIGQFIDGKMHLGAVSIPYGYGFYIPPYTIHNDCFLVGKYRVLYTVTEDYSTVLLRNLSNKYMKFNIVE